MSKPDATKCAIPCVEVESTVLQQIRRHARSSMQAEICGVLIGGEKNGITRIDACIAGEGAAQGGAHVTYTQETWAHIYKVKDAQFPDLAIVGWYHSHPGFGVFLSDHDLFIHQNFFSAPHQVAWVFDPHSDEEGCFGWVDERVEPLSRISVVRRQPMAGQAVPSIEPMATRQSGDAAKSQKDARRSSWLLVIAKAAALALILFLVFGIGFVTGERFDQWIEDHHKGGVVPTLSPAKVEEPKKPVAEPPAKVEEPKKPVAASPAKVEETIKPQGEPSPSPSGQPTPQK
jgi:proteasome lid subunit RPN8/RPN11